MAHVMFAEAAGQGDPASVEGIVVADPETPPTSEDMWCCIHHILSLQEDFQTEKPLIQSLIKDMGHICLFLP